MDLEESDVQIAVVGLTWTLLYLEDADKCQTDRLRNAQRPTVRRRRPKRWWVRSWLDADRRLKYGHLHRLMEELRLEEVDSLKKFPEDGPEMFECLAETIPSASELRYWFLWQLRLSFLNEWQQRIGHSRFSSVTAVFTQRQGLAWKDRRANEEFTPRQRVIRHAYASVRRTLRPSNSIRTKIRHRIAIETS